MIEKKHFYASKSISCILLHKKIEPSRRLYLITNTKEAYTKRFSRAKTCSW